jgi:hypothetical protein
VLLLLLLPLPLLLLLLLLLLMFVNGGVVSVIMSCWMGW